MRVELLDEAVKKAAEIPIWQVHSNPRVGCAIACLSGKVFFGVHEKFAEAHAEANAITEVKCAGDSAEGSTVYVSLEPCSHFGKTPPCVEALIQAKVKKVVVGSLDPFQDRAGKGVALLKQNGIAVEVVNHASSHSLNLEWFFALQYKRPFVRLKIATTLDGFFALRNGESKYITGSGARARVHELRALSQGILTSAKTIEQDRAQLTVRLKNYRGPQPKVFVLPPRKRELNDLKVGRPSGGTLSLELLSGRDLSSVDLTRLALLDPGLSLKNNLEKLYSEFSIHSLLVEAGPALSGSFLIESELVQELYHFVSPKYFGEGIGFSSPIQFEKLSGRRGVRVEYEKVEPDELLVKTFFY